MQAPSALAAVARTFPLPDHAQSRVNSFLELYDGLPDSSPVWQELANVMIVEDELCVKILDNTTRVVMSWQRLHQGRRRGQEVWRIYVDIFWQKWLKADVAPWSVDVRRILLPQEANAYVKKSCMATHAAEATPAGVREALQWAKEQWKTAALGPCPACGTAEGERPTKRMRLACSQLCARCTLNRVIQQ
jgi:endogenous inhibitor of DNA gyrase (YacG/DUF329 family)